MKFGKNDEAVSPVIGVILMVAITVILAAVIAAFVFGMGPPVKTPQVNLKLTKANSTGTGSINITHVGGDSLALKDVKIIVTQSSTTLTFNPASSTTGDYALTVQDTLNIAVAGAVFVGTTNTGASVSGTATLTDMAPSKNVKVTLVYNPSGQVLADMEAAAQDS